MIYKMTFEDGRIDWCTAKSQLHLLKSYDNDFDFSIQELESIEEISEDQSKTIMVMNTEFNENDDMPEEVSLWELAFGDDFTLIASTEFE